MVKKAMLIIMLILLSPIVFAGTGTLYASDWDPTRLLLNYHLDINNPTQYDSSGNGLDGTVTGATFTVLGKKGGAYFFDGNDNIQISTTLLSDAEGATISAWVNPKVNNSRMDIIGSDFKINMELNSDGTFRCNTWNATNDDCGWVASTTKAVPDQWYYVTCNKNQTHQYIMINGVLENDDACVGNIRTRSENFKVGSNSGASSYFFNGTIDSVSIYNKSQDPDKVLDLYNGILETNISIRVDPTPFAFSDEDLVGYCQDNVLIDLLSSNISYEYRWFLNDILNSSGIYPTESNYCYQEFANVSTSCGGRSTGTYEANNFDSSTDYKLYDGDWSTYGNGLGDNTSVLIVNYAVPHFVADNNLIRFKNGNVTGATEINITILDTCMDQARSTDYLRLNYTVQKHLANGNVTIYCENETDGWTQLHQTVWVGWGERLYEDGIYWNMSTSTNSTDEVNVATLSSSVTDLNQEWHLSCRATNGVGGFTDWVNSTATDTYDFEIFNCSDTTNATMIFNIYNEEYPTQSEIADFEVDIAYWYYSQDHLKNFSALLENNNTYAICINRDDKTINADVYVKYTTATGFTHRYIIANQTFNRSARTYSIYNFNTTAGISDLKITARDKDTYAYYPNVIGKLQRFYTGEGVWRTVQMDQSGDFGFIFFNIKEENTDYKVVFTDRQNNILKTTASLKFVCTSGVCEITYLLDPYTATTATSGLSALSNYSNSTQTLSVSWTDSQSGSNTIRIRVIKDTITGELVICDQTQTGSSGSYNCNLSAYTGDIYLRVDGNDDVLLSEYVKITNKYLARTLSVPEQSLWTFAIMLTVIMFGLFSPVGAIITMIIGLIVVYFLGLFNPISITFIIVAAAIGIAIGLKIKK